MNTFFLCSLYRNQTYLFINLNENHVSPFSGFFSWFMYTSWMTCLITFLLLLYSDLILRNIIIQCLMFTENAHCEPITEHNSHLFLFTCYITDCYLTFLCLSFFIYNMEIVKNNTNIIP